MVHASLGVRQRMTLSHGESQISLQARMHHALLTSTELTSSILIFLRWRPSFFLGTIQMGAFLFLILALVIGAGVAYKMGYLDPYIEQIKQQAGKQ
ncbi:unnamed protein product [Toxocara canis]|uniref:Uncharacterized protein n=1 Tax=Toxocara canis TaxID=6265 RepID=A0A183U1C2_TOXCA|nr:unnamed protein product [Toxocara canis]